MTFQEEIRPNFFGMEFEGNCSLWEMRSRIKELKLRGVLMRTPNFKEGKN